MNAYKIANIIFLIAIVLLIIRFFVSLLTPVHDLADYNYIPSGLSYYKVNVEDCKIGQTFYQEERSFLWIWRGTYNYNTVTISTHSGGEMEIVVGSSSPFIPTSGALAIGRVRNLNSKAQQSCPIITTKYLDGSGKTGALLTSVAGIVVFIGMLLANTMRAIQYSDDELYE